MLSLNQMFLFQLCSRRETVRMSYMLPHLHNGWQVDQAILSEEDRVLVIRFGHDWDPTCMKMDEVLYSIAEKVGLVSDPAWCRPKLQRYYQLTLVSDL